MFEKILINKINHTDLNMYKCGIEDCTPGHSWGPGVRDHYLIHYIHSGKGIFHANNTTYHLKKNQGFLICPDKINYYQADPDEPWSYSWVGFHGLKAEYYLKQAGLTAESPVFTYEKDNYLKDCLTGMVEDAKTLTRSSEVHIIGLLYLFLSRLIEVPDDLRMNDRSEERKDIYIKKATEFIRMNYSRKISIAEVSYYVGLDRSYLYSIFKDYYNTSPQGFLINLRIDKACELMNNNALSIGDIARSVGYEDTLLFSKVFKKNKGLAPREYRKKQQTEIFKK